MLRTRLVGYERSKQLRIIQLNYDEPEKLTRQSSFWISSPLNKLGSSVDVWEEENCEDKLAKALDAVRRSNARETNEYPQEGLNEIEV